MDRTLQLLGIAKKAGLLAVGGDDVSAATRNGKAWLVISAGDASEGTIRRARINAETGNAFHTVSPYTKFEIGTMTRRGSPGTVAILDAGLACAFLKGLAETDPEQYKETAERLAQEARKFEERKKRPPSGNRRTAQ